MKTLLRKLLLSIMSTWVWRYVLTWWIPAIRFGGKPLNEEVIAEIQSVIQVGDCILMKDPYKLSNILIGGQWSHAAICTQYITLLGPIISEMGHAGYQELRLQKALSNSKHVAILRPKGRTVDYALEMAADARWLGLACQGYDFSFSHGESSLYCSELVALADRLGLYKADPSDLAGLGHEYISPDGLYKAKGAVIVYEV